MPTLPTLAAVAAAAVVVLAAVARWQDLLPEWLQEHRASLVPQVLRRLTDNATSTRTRTRTLSHTHTHTCSSSSSALTSINGPNLGTTCIQYRQQLLCCIALARQQEVDLDWSTPQHPLARRQCSA